MSTVAKINVSQPHSETEYVQRITLNPGDFRFYVPMVAAVPPSLYTLLGSCVSVILWHPELRQGGMSHALLPVRPVHKSAKELDGRYCEDAVALFRRELARTNTVASQYHAYIVGGGNMFQATSKKLIGDRNVEVTRAILRQAGFRIRAEHVCGDVYRTTELDLNSGTVVVTINQKREQISY